MPTIEEIFDDLIHLLSVKGRGNPTQILFKLMEIKNQLTSDLVLKADLITGKVPTTQLPNSVIHALEYKGGWDASGAVYPTPTGLEKGWYYVITTGGTIGGTVYIIGDWIIYNGTSWDRLSYESYTSGNFNTDFGLKDTDDLTEGVKKFWSQTLFNNAFGAKSLAALGTKLHSSLSSVGTSDHHIKTASGEISLNDLLEKSTDSLAEGTKKFWSQSLFNTAFGVKSTADLSELTNLYHTVARVEAIITDEIAGGQSIDNAIDSLILAHKNLASAHHAKTTSGEINLNDLAEKDHANLTNVLTSQHHVKTVALDSFPFLISQLIDFAPYLYYYRVLNSSGDALICFYMKCPETRNDWKLEILYGNSFDSSNIDYRLSLGKNSNEQVMSINNLYNNYDVIFSNTTGGYRYSYTSAVFTVNKGDSVQGKLDKQFDEGGGYSHIYGINLIY